MEYDEKFMRQALELAELARGYTNPNPLVGAVVVNQGRVVGVGWHRQYGTQHAEVLALQQAGSWARGATLYVTLEPCAHYGKTPPCTRAIIEAGVSEVYVGIIDPNPRVSGKGIKALEAAGIRVRTGFLQEELQQQNAVFLHWIKYRRPYIALKLASSLDGKLATAGHESQWITGSASRAYVHRLRSEYMAILTGSGTIAADNPQLTVRQVEGKNPIRIILDSKLRLSPEASVFTDKQSRTIVATSRIKTSSVWQQRYQELIRRGIEVLILEASIDGRINLPALLAALAELQITSILVEGGSGINGSFIEQHLVDYVYNFIAPKIIGGDTAPSSVGGSGLRTLSECVKLKNIQILRLEDDILLHGSVERGE